jgi:hypothetical protein
MDQFKFKDLPNTAVITMKKIINKQAWIGYVTHDIEDGSWQFLDSKLSQKNTKEAAVVSLQNIVDLDPKIVELADLPLGWYAWRETGQSPWNKSKCK